MRQREAHKCHWSSFKILKSTNSKFKLYKEEKKTSIERKSKEYTLKKYINTVQLNKPNRNTYFQLYKTNMKNRGN